MDPGLSSRQGLDLGSTALLHWGGDRAVSAHTDLQRDQSPHQQMSTNFPELRTDGGTCPHGGELGARLLRERGLERRLLQPCSPPQAGVGPRDPEDSHS